MHTTVINIISKRDCGYTFRGVNLADMRRAALYQIGKALDLAKPNMSKNELLGALIARLKHMGADSEIVEWIGKSA